MGSIVVAPPEHATSIDSLTLSDRYAAYARLEPIFSFIYLFGHIVVDTYSVNTRALAAAAAEKKQHIFARSSRAFFVQHRKGLLRLSIA